MYIFRFQRDISLMQFWFCSLLAQWNRGGVGCETRGRVRGEVLLVFFFFFSFSPPRRARSGNGMRQHGMLPQDPVAVFGFHGLRASKSEFSGGGVGFRCSLLKFRTHTHSS